MHPRLAFPSNHNIRFPHGWKGFKLETEFVGVCLALFLVNISHTQYGVFYILLPAGINNLVIRRVAKLVGSEFQLSALVEFVFVRKRLPMNSVR
jgi:hypothetical protein